MNRSRLALLCLLGYQLWLLGCMPVSPPAIEASANPSPTSSTQPSPSPATSLSASPLAPATAAALAEFRQIATEQPNNQAIVDRISQHPDQVEVMVKRCESTVADAMARGSQFYPLSDSSYLVMLQCFMGAYQGSAVLYLYRETGNQAELKPLNLKQIDQDGGVTTKTNSNLITGYAKFDPAQQTLVVRNKYRGVGDCGTIGTYSLKNQEFVLTKYEADFDCDGKLNFQPIAP